MKTGKIGKKPGMIREKDRKIRKSMERLERRMGR